MRGFLLREKTLKPYLKQAQVAASPLIPSRRSRLCLFSRVGWFFHAPFSFLSIFMFCSF